MTNACATIEEWKQINAHRLIDCPRGCRITPEACHAYRSRAREISPELIDHLDTFAGAYAEPVTCMFPEPCTHLMAEEYAQALDHHHSVGDVRDNGERRLLARRHRLRQQLTNPNVMLEEEEWRRSLVCRP